MRPAIKRLYFGHPKGTYGIPIETATIGRIYRSFLWKDFPTLVNPNEPVHEAAAAEYRKTHPEGSSMPYFLALVRSCDAGVFLLMPDGRWGYGTYLEALEMLERGAPIWSIAWDGTVMPVDHIPPKRAMTREETSDWNKGLREGNKPPAP